ncbi:MAG TPA: type II toxin-antitoxin system death-on-curing family toxin [Candidatus Paceibacterota bacterium]|jgi:death-on-curing protein|nr:type II toxin-antitoxin system death-on-curing family toxin [Candidatus Paceibacterota bacterium]
MRYLTVIEIIAIHDDIIKGTTGMVGVRDIELLDHVVKKPKMAFGGKDIHPDVFSKAASYCESFAHHQVFVDGNKRTALASAERFLFLNGFELVSGNGLTEQFLLKVATKEITGDDVVHWIEKHSRRLSRRVA